MTKVRTSPEQLRAVAVLRRLSFRHAGVTDRHHPAVGHQLTSSEGFRHALPKPHGQSRITSRPTTSAVLPGSITVFMIVS